MSQSHSSQNPGKERTCPPSGNPWPGLSVARDKLLLYTVIRAPATPPTPWPLTLWMGISPLLVIAPKTSGVAGVPERVVVMELPPFSRLPLCHIFTGVSP